MKTLNLAATLMLLGTLTLGISATVDEQITTITSATPEERVELVNEFKETLATLSDEDRAAAIALLRESVSQDGEQLQTRTRTQTRSRINQADQADDMLRSEQMQQTRAGTQAMQQDRIGAGVPADGSTPNRFMGNR